jgi:hypothetical protein
MKLHAYKSTPFGIERVNSRPLTTAEAKAMLRANPSLIIRDAESASYEVLHMPIDWQEEEPTDKEKAIASNLKAVIVFALTAGIVLFILERLT